MRFQVLTTDLMPAAFELATEIFVESSTLHKALNIQLGDYRDYLKPSFEAMVSEGLSIVAIDLETSEVIGCLIAYDFHSHIQQSNKAKGKFTPLAALSKALCTSFLEQRAINAGETILLDMAAITPTHLGRGIYQNMRNAAHDHARAQGYKSVISELSSVTTQHVVLGKLEHCKLAEVMFAEFEQNNKKPFQSIKEPSSIILAQGRL